MGRSSIITYDEEWRMSEIYQLRQGELEGFSELVQGVNLGGWRVLQTFQTLDMSIGQVSPLGKLFLRPAVFSA